MLPSPIGLGIAAGALVSVIVALRLMLRPTAGSPGVVSWTILPGLARGIRAWVRPRRPVLPISAGAMRSEDGEPLDVPSDRADEATGDGDGEDGDGGDGADVADSRVYAADEPVATVEVRHQQVGVRH